MTNWKKFEITSKEWTCGNPTFYLDGNIAYENGIRKFIICGNRFNDCQVGDCLEIDTSRIKNCCSGTAFSDTSIVRKVSSSAVVSSNSSQQMTTSQFQAIGNEMMNRAERSNGQMEARWIAREEYRTDGSVSTREFGWRYGSKN